MSIIILTNQARVAESVFVYNKKGCKKSYKNAERHKLLKSMELWRGKSASTSFVTRVFPLANGRGGKAVGTRLCLSRVILRFFCFNPFAKRP